MLRPVDGFCIIVDVEQRHDVAEAPVGAVPVVLTLDNLFYQ